MSFAAFLVYVEADAMPEQRVRLPQTLPTGLQRI
jgi:hypothetical protein